MVCFLFVHCVSVERSGASVSLSASSYVTSAGTSSYTQARYYHPLLRGGYRVPENPPKNDNRFLPIHIQN